MSENLIWMRELSHFFARTYKDCTFAISTPYGMAVRKVLPISHNNSERPYRAISWMKTWLQSVHKYPHIPQMTSSTHTKKSRQHDPNNNNNNNKHSNSKATVVTRQRQRQLIYIDNAINSNRLGMNNANWYKWKELHKAKASAAHKQTQQMQQIHREKKNVKLHQRAK